MERTNLRSITLTHQPSGKKDNALGCGKFQTTSKGVVEGNSLTDFFRNTTAVMSVIPTLLSVRTPSEWLEEKTFQSMTRLNCRGITSRQEVREHPRSH
jgi:hypothetical protein